ncbi:MAG: hypothetical protein IPL78_00770 [Chloroflexi bacterium]|nr:hypothetical protein [Chloroflexota bacterium]
MTAGTYPAAIHRSSSDPSLGLDKDVYQVVVPAGQAITATTLLTARQLRPVHPTG